MPFRVHPDGSITADTLEEAVQVARALANAGASSPEPASPPAPALTPTPSPATTQPEPVEEIREGAKLKPTHWTRSLAREYLAALPKPEYVTMVRQILETKDEMTILEFMERWDYAQSGIGRRFKTLKDTSARVAPDLPAAIKLNGPKGARVITINFSFANAAEEVFSE